MNKVAETFAPGEFLKEELETRNWNQLVLADIIGRPARLVNEIIAGKRAITPETAVQLGDALGTGPELWMNLESQYQLSKVKSPSGIVARKARLYGKFPVREMLKRNWAQPSENIEVLEQQFLAFFRIGSLDEVPVFAHAAKKSTRQNAPSVSQLAWLFRARSIASSLVVNSFNKRALAEALPRLHALLSAPEEIRHVTRILNECGVRLVLVEPLPRSKIDGACFWLNKSQPSIALSLRLDRIDSFWFVLRHEIEHVLRGHGQETCFILDQDLEGIKPGKAENEEEVANAAAAEFCVPSKELLGFMARVSPYFSEERICLFAQRLGVHPGVVVGQLQRKLDRYDLLKKHQVRVRHLMTRAAPVDGWGLVEQS